MLPQRWIALHHHGIAAWKDQLTESQKLMKHTRLLRKRCTATACEDTQISNQRYAATATAGMPMASASLSRDSDAADDIAICTLLLN